MSHADTGERLARLETEMGVLTKDFEEQKECLSSMRETLEEINKELSRYKGFVGGILFVGSALMAFIKGLPFITTFFHK